jgi:hypothetical protein
LKVAETVPYLLGDGFAEALQRMRSSFNPQNSIVV